MACGTKHQNGDTGGSEDAIVVSHNHTQDGHTHSPTSSRKYIAVSGDDNWGYSSKITMSYTSTERYYYPRSDKNDGGITEQTATTSAQPYIYYKGESGTGKNMPPYLTVYMWKRIA